MRSNYLVACLALPALTIHAGAQVLLQDSSTDTIEVAGHTAVTDAMTMEARLMLTCEDEAGGVVYNEWQAFAEDKQFGVTPGGFWAYAHPINAGNVFSVNTPISVNEWHHVAYVYDGAEERLYLDGKKVAARPASGQISHGDFAILHVGTIPRDGHENHTFVGFLDTLRISNVARYLGNSFNPPQGDLTPKQGTELLFNFNDPHGSDTVQDESHNAFVGTLGAGPCVCSMPSLTDGQRCEADCDGDCAYTLTLFDFLCFVNKFNEQDPYADCDASGDFTLFDFLCYVNLFNEGCY